MRVARRISSDVLVPLLAGGHEVLMRFLPEVSDLGDPFSHPSVGQVTGEAGSIHLELTWSHVSLHLRPQPPRQDMMSVRRQRLRATTRRALSLKLPLCCLSLTILN